jgi:hypothetical protein
MLTWFAAPLVMWKNVRKKRCFTVFMQLHARRAF